MLYISLVSMVAMTSALHILYITLLYLFLMLSMSLTKFLLCPETLEEPDPSTNEGGNLASISATTEISELENMLKQKTFTRLVLLFMIIILLSAVSELI